MENLIRGLDAHSLYLSDDEVLDELVACGVDIALVLTRASIVEVVSSRVDVSEHAVDDACEVNAVADIDIKL